MARYNSRDLACVVRAAIKSVKTKPVYVFATLYGYKVWNCPPPLQDYVIVRPDGSTERIVYQTGCPA